eukprot:Hpha_TRINITY_DN14086_c0_g1::TRINITY_DN14086_c0_g1_i1::g.43990::m.43990
MVKLCVVGAGNSAHVTAALASVLDDVECTMFAGRGNEAELINEGISRGGIRAHYGPDDGNEVVRGVPSCVSENAIDVVPGAEVIILALPALAYEVNLRAIAPFVDEGAIIGTLCASGGFDWVVDAVMRDVGRKPSSYTLFAIQNLPWACRITDFGYEVQVLGAKPFMDFTARPVERTTEVAELITRLIRVKQIPHPTGFLGFGMSNMCMVLHPAIMHDVFHTWDGSTPYDTPPLFYQGLSEAGAKSMHRLSDEVMAVRGAIEREFPSANLSVVHHVKQWTIRAYGKYITDKTNLYTQFRSNTAYTGLTCPMEKLPNGKFLPGFKARYLSEDIPCNLCALKGVAELTGTPTPEVDKILMWAQGVLGKEYMVRGRMCGRDLGQTFAPQRFGYTTLHSIPELRRLRKSNARCKEGDEMMQQTRFVPKYVPSQLTTELRALSKL